MDTPLLFGSHTKKSFEDVWNCRSLIKQIQPSRGYKIDAFWRFWSTEKAFTLILGSNLCLYHLVLFALET